MLTALFISWLLGAVAFGWILMLPIEKHSARLSALETGAIVMLWPTALLVILLGVNKFVRDEYEAK